MLTYILDSKVRPAVQITSEVELDYKRKDVDIVLHARGFDFCL